MKRSLIMLFVLAMVAMMIPSFAMAEGVGTTTPVPFEITASKTAYTASLTHSYRYAYPDIYILAKTDELWGCEMSLPTDQNYITFDDEDDDYYVSFYNLDPSYSVYVPNFHILAEGKTTLTVVATSYNGETATAKIDIEVKKAPKTEAIGFVLSQITEADKQLTVGDDPKYYPVSITKPEEETYYGYKFLWSVSDPKVANVDRNGNVTALAEGTFDLTVTAIDNAEATDTLRGIEVKAAKEEEKPKTEGPTLKFNTSEFTVEKGRSVDIGRYLTIVDAVAYDEYIWTTSNSDIVNIYGEASWTTEGTEPYLSVNGIEVGGPVTITVRSRKFPTAVATCTVTVVKSTEQLESISFTAVPATIELGESLSISPYLNLAPVDRTYTFMRSLVWSSSNPQVAYVNDGYLYTMGVGSATITAVYKEDTSKTASFDITVVPVPVTKINFAKSEYTLIVGRAYDFTENIDYCFEPSNYTKGGYARVTWTSDNDDVVRAYSSNIEAENIGEANITMTVRNADGSVVVSDPIKVTVTDKAPTAIGFKKDTYTFKMSHNKDTKSMALKLTPADAFVEDGDLYVTSSDPTVATATVNGTEVYVYAYKGGETTLTVKSHSKPELTGTTKFVVDPIKLESVALEEAVTLSYYTDAKGNVINSTKTYRSVITPSDAFCKATWETSDPSVLLVDGTESGRYVDIIPVGAGTATVTLTATDGTNTFTANMQVTVKAAKVTKLTLSTTKATVYMIKGEDNTLQLTATDTKTDEVVPVAWKSSNNKIATVSKKGLVTFKSAGKVTITATTKDGNATTAKCVLTVKVLKVTSVVPAKKAISMKAGTEATLKVTVKPAKAYNKALAFKSSNKKIVTVDAEGNLKALKAGKAVITVTARDGSKKSAKINVTVTGVANNDEAVDEIVEDVFVEDIELDNIVEIDDVVIDDEAIEVIDEDVDVAID